MTLLLVFGWLFFSSLIWLAEHEAAGTHITSFGAALYWGVAAFSTAGIADTPVTDTARLVGGLWIVLGSMLFFGSIVATVTTYFMRPMQRPHRMIIDTIEYNLEQLDDLTLDEIDLLKDTVDALIGHVEKLKDRHGQEQGEKG
jgi:voltage-gated potassium channel